MTKTCHHTKSLPKKLSHFQSLVGYIYILYLESNLAKKLFLQRKKTCWNIKKCFSVFFSNKKMYLKNKRKKWRRGKEKERDTISLGSLYCKKKLCYSQHGGIGIYHLHLLHANLEQKIIAIYTLQLSSDVTGKVVLPFAFFAIF